MVIILAAVWVIISVAAVKGVQRGIRKKNDWLRQQYTRPHSSQAGHISPSRPSPANFPMGHPETGHTGRNLGMEMMYMQQMQEMSRTAQAENEKTPPMPPCGMP